ncbi:hypothetical protein Tco_0920372 [Tanacetum coccineum]
MFLLWPVAVEDLMIVAEQGFKDYEFLDISIYQKMKVLSRFQRYVEVKAKQEKDMMASIDDDDDVNNKLSFGAKVLAKKVKLGLRRRIEMRIRMVNVVMLWVTKGNSTHVSIGSVFDGLIRRIHGLGYGVLKVWDGYSVSILWIRRIHVP